MKITFDAIYVPSYIDKPTAYFIVTPQTYRNSIGFYPVTYNEYFGVKNNSIDIGKEYLNKHQYFTDRVYMYTYELLYSDVISLWQRLDVQKMISTLQNLNRITHINIELDIDEKLLDDEEEIKRRKDDR